MCRTACACARRTRTFGDEWDTAENEGADPNGRRVQPRRGVEQEQGGGAAGEAAAAATLGKGQDHIPAARVSFSSVCKGGSRSTDARARTMPNCAFANDIGVMSVRGELSLLHTIACNPSWPLAVERHGLVVLDESIASVDGSFFARLISRALAAGTCVAPDGLDERASREIPPISQPNLRDLMLHQTRSSTYDAHENLMNGRVKVRRRSLEDGGQTSVIMVPEEPTFMNNRWVEPYNASSLRYNATSLRGCQCSINDSDLERIEAYIDCYVSKGPHAAA